MQTPGAPSANLVMLLAGTAGEVAASALREAWERWIGPQRFDRKLAQLERAGWASIQSKSASLERIVRITEAGRLMALGGRDPEAHWGRPWDGRWRMVVFDVPETQRALRLRLRRVLRSLRFGYLQNSVWVSPDGVQELRDTLRNVGVDAESLAMMEGVPCGGESDQDIVEGAWDFGRINRGYADYLEILKRAPATSLSRASQRKWLAVEWRAWCRAIGADPLLPEALLPKSYQGREAWNRRCRQLPRLLRES